MPSVLSTVCLLDHFIASLTFQTDHKINNIVNEKPVALFYIYLNFLLNNKILDLSKLKALSDNKINETEKLKFILESVEKIVGKGEKNAGYRHFLLFSLRLKVRIVW